MGNSQNKEAAEQKEKKDAVAKVAKKTSTKVINLDTYFGKIEQEPRDTRWGRAIDLLMADNGGPEKFVCILEIKGQRWFTFKK